MLFVIGNQLFIIYYKTYLCIESFRITWIDTEQLKTMYLRNHKLWITWNEVLTVILLGVSSPPQTPPPPSPSSVLPASHTLNHYLFKWLWLWFLFEIARVSAADVGEAVKVVWLHIVGANLWQTALLSRHILIFRFNMHQTLITGIFAVYSKLS